MVSMRFTYDNSAENIRNPNRPPQRVVAGNRASDEMAHLWLQVLPKDSPGAAVDPRASDSRKRWLVTISTRIPMTSKRITILPHCCKLEVNSPNPWLNLIKLSVFDPDDPPPITRLAQLFLPPATPANPFPIYLRPLRRGRAILTPITIWVTRSRARRFHRRGCAFRRFGSPGSSGCERGGKSRQRSCGNRKQSKKPACTTSGPSNSIPITS